jgi:hypothetical protein
MPTNNTAAVETGSVALPGIGALLKESIAFYKKNWKKIFAIGMPMIVLWCVYVVSLLLTVYVLEIFSIITLLSVIALFVYTINFAVSLILYFKDPKDTQSPQQIRTAGWSYFWPWVLVALLAVLAAAPGWVLLIVPGIIISIRLGFAQFTVIAENKRGLSALGRSWYLVSGNGWKILGRQIVLALLVIATSLILGLVKVFAGKTVGGLLTQFISLLVLTPISVFYSYRMYHIITAAKESNEDAEKKYAKKAKIIAWFSPVAFIIFIVLFASISASLPPPAPQIIPQSGVPVLPDNASGATSTVQ